MTTPDQDAASPSGAQEVARERRRLAALVLRREIDASLDARAWSDVRTAVDLLERLTARQDDALAEMILGDRGGATAPGIAPPDPEGLGDLDVVTDPKYRAHLKAYSDRLRDMHGYPRLALSAPDPTG